MLMCMPGQMVIVTVVNEFELAFAAAEFGIHFLQGIPNDGYIFWVAGGKESFASSHGFGFACLQSL